MINTSDLILRFLDTRVEFESESDSLFTDRGYLFGDGFFTTGIVKNGQLLHQTAHRQRLQSSAQKLKFLPIDWQGLFNVLSKKLTSEDNACIRISVTRAQTARGYRIDKQALAHIRVILSALPKLPSGYCELFFARTPASSNPLLAGLKHLNRLDSVLAASEIENDEQTQNQESLLCLDDSVICGSRSNLFILRDGSWLTPKLNRAGVAGITRKRLIQAMKSHQIPIKETEISRQQLLECDAALITNSLLGIWSVQKIQDRELATQLPENLKCQLDFQR